MKRTYFVYSLLFYNRREELVVFANIFLRQAHVALEGERVKKTLLNWFIYPDAGHVIPGSLKVISESRIRHTISKGPKYRFPNRIDLKNVGKK